MTPFILHGGAALASLEDLLSALPKMADDVFNHHVRPDCNDFSRWIAIELSNPLLAHEIRYCKTREELYRLLSKEMGLAFPPSKAAAPSKAAIDAPKRHDKPPPSSPAGSEEVGALLVRLEMLEGQVQEFLRERANLREEIGQYLREKAAYLNNVAMQTAIQTASVKEMADHRERIEGRLLELAGQIDALKAVLSAATIEFFTQIGEGHLCLERNEVDRAMEIYRELRNRFTALDDDDKLHIYGPLRAFYQELAGRQPSASGGAQQQS